MHVLFGKYVSLVLLLVTIGVALALYFGYQSYIYTEASAETALVTRGDISVTVTVSGKVEAKQTAKLNFPTTGVVQHVYKREGDHVMQGELIASLVQDSRIAAYNAARETLQYYTHEKSELLNGPRPEERAVTETNVTIAKEALERTKVEHAQLVENALRALNSSNLEAVTASYLNDDIPPTITGNYLCEREGSYVIALYKSGSASGYSYKLSGLEEGTFDAYTDTPTPLGTCGLMVQFDADELYRTDTWTVAIPNTRAATYTEYLNMYKLARTQEENALRAAEQALALAEKTALNNNAPPTRESLEKIDAQISEARANLALQEALIADVTIKAPFDGIITDIGIKVGEAVDQTKTITLLQEGLYELTARIPEVDISKVSVGKTARIFFDAEPEQEIIGYIDFISPLSSEVGGVAYYDARITLASEPPWIRSGLNADVHIVAEEKKNTALIPKRFVSTENGESYIYTKVGDVLDCLTGSIG